MWAQESVLPGAAPAGGAGEALGGLDRRPAPPPLWAGRVRRRTGVLGACSVVPCAPRPPLILILSTETLNSTSGGRELRIGRVGPAPSFHLARWGPETGDTEGRELSGAPHRGSAPSPAIHHGAEVSLAWGSSRWPGWPPVPRLMMGALNFPGICKGLTLLGTVTLPTLSSQGPPKPLCSPIPARWLVVPGPAKQPTVIPLHPAPQQTPSTKPALWLWPPRSPLEL